jgi:hypothetical protein
MTYEPLKPRKPGKTGGSAYNKVNRSTHASARVHQKANKSGCLGILIVFFVISVTVAGGTVASLLS